MTCLKVFMVAGAMAAFSTAWAQDKGPCAADVAKLCKDVQPGEGHVLACLKTNQASVSAQCKTYLKQVKDACQGDVEKFCSGIPAGKGAVGKCLKKHSADLSSDCKATFAKAKKSKS
jgi:hypothetical protein